MSKTTPADGDALLAFAIARESDARHVVRILEKCQGLTGVRLEAIGTAGFAIFAPPVASSNRLEQLQAYCAGAMDCLREAAGAFEPPAAEPKPLPPV